MRSADICAALLKIQLAKWQAELGLMQRESAEMCKTVRRLRANNQLELRLSTGINSLIQ